jgi:hypothetical protein
MGEQYDPYRATEGHSVLSILTGGQPCSEPMWEKTDMTRLGGDIEDLGEI